MKSACIEKHADADTQNTSLPKTHTLTLADAYVHDFSQIQSNIHLMRFLLHRM